MGNGERNIKEIMKDVLISTEVLMLHILSAKNSMTVYFGCVSLHICEISVTFGYLCVFSQSK